MKTYVETGTLPEALKPYQEAFAAADISEVERWLSRWTVEPWAYENKADLFIDAREGVGLICAAFHPAAGFCSPLGLQINEYRELLGGSILSPLRRTR